MQQPVWAIHLVTESHFTHYEMMKGFVPLHAFSYESAAFVVDSVIRNVEVRQTVIVFEHVA